jgi:hypothetical protein
MAGDMADKRNTEEITPVSLAGVGVDDGPKVSPKGPLQKEPSQDIIASSTVVDISPDATPSYQLARDSPENTDHLPSTSTDSAKSELESGRITIGRINAHAQSEQKDAAIEGAQGPDSQDEQTDKKNEDDAGNVNPEHNIDDKPYSIFTHNEKRIIILCAGLSQFFSPISGQIYFPSLDAIAADLHVSNSLVNLTITTYLVSALVKSRPKFTY